MLMFFLYMLRQFRYFIVRKIFVVYFICYLEYLLVNLDSLTNFNYIYE